MYLLINFLKKLFLQSYQIALIQNSIVKKSDRELPQLGSFSPRTSWRISEPGAKLYFSYKICYYITQLNYSGNQCLRLQLISVALLGKIDKRKKGKNWVVSCCLFSSAYDPTVDKDTFIINNTQPTTMQGEQMINVAKFCHEESSSDFLKHLKFRLLKKITSRWCRHSCTPFLVFPVSTRFMQFFISSNSVKKKSLEVNISMYSLLQVKICSISTMAMYMRTLIEVFDQFKTIEFIFS